jgi:hypothetical protein
LLPSLSEWCCLYNHRDEEFLGSMKVLFSGDGVVDIKRDDLVVLAINHITRHYKRFHPERSLPEICSIL